MQRYESLEEFARRRDWAAVEQEAHRLRNEAIAAWVRGLWGRVVGKTRAA